MVRYLPSPRPLLRALTAVLTGAALSLTVPHPAWAAYTPKTPPLTTPWTNQVSTTNPLPEYPRPQLTRAEWQSLNGQWQFTGSTQTDSPPVGQTLAETVLVPYPIESALSGIMRHEDNMWYRRTFTVPSRWSGRHVQLNFGAVNWQTAVWVNGTRVGGHTGAYDSFSFDITAALTTGTNELIVGIWSPVDRAGIPVGKQRLNPGGIMYTASSGIWQTVWIEPTTAAHITRLDTTPDVPGGVLDLVAQVSGGTATRVHAEVLSGGTVVGSANGAPGAHLRIPVPNAHLWNPDDPFLYDLRVTLTGPGGRDTVRGYFGMRSVGKAMVNGFLRPVVNGKFIFQLGTLDQGYWPDGGYTAPTDSALRFDLEQQKNLGFNTVRKHIKVEPARWYYWADKLGLLVWQDMPSMAVSPSAADKTNFESELRRMVDQLRGITAIVQWQPFNEGWGAYDPARIADLVKSWDPTRLVDNNSGGNCCGSVDGGNGDVVDDHNYPGPGTTRLPSATRVAALGEFGGIALPIDGHDWPVIVSPYTMATDRHNLTARYVETTDTLQGLINSRGLSSSIYTQPTDVEGEINGLWTYDRQIFKPDSADQVRAANLAVLAAAGGLRTDNLVSLGVTTSGYTDRYLRHSAGLGVTSPVTSTSDPATKQDSTFWLRPGLADPACYSFESRNYPGRYLRHSDYRIRADAEDGTAVFDADATFCVRTGHTASGVSFESYNLPGRFLRQATTGVYVAARGGQNSRDTAASWADDTTWQVAAPWWRSGADLALTTQSLQVVTPGYTDRYLRHYDGLASTTVVTPASDETLKSDASFIVHAGLADDSCYSFESRNYPGQYLRHSSFRIRKDTEDGTALFASDATFCAQPGRYGSGDVTFASYNLAAHNLRHIDGEVWIAANGGPNTWEGATSYDADSTWHIAPAWAP